MNLPLKVHVTNVHVTNGHNGLEGHKTEGREEKKTIAIHYYKRNKSGLREAVALSSL